MKHYIIDGNNVIGKSKELTAIQKKDKSLSREKLAFKAGNYFRDKKYKVTIHFDGFKNLTINIPNIKIVYSDKKEADATIRKQIEQSTNPREVILVSSDYALQNFARACACEVLPSEDFNKLLNERNDIDDENNKIESMNKEVNEFKKLFGV
jgi:predicted RNA-binding protein with PIN domain